MKKNFLWVLISVIVLFSACTENGHNISDESFNVTLFIQVNALLDNMDLLDINKHELIPANGIIFPETVVVAYEGESVFEVLNREMRNAGIHLVFKQMPVFDSAYVEAINNIFEFDAGVLSGWMYRVNDEFPGFGASSYVLQPDDYIEWLYTVDLGRGLNEADESE